MVQKKHQDSFRQKKLALIAILAGAILVIYYPLFKSWMFEKPRIVPEDVPPDDSGNASAEGEENLISDAARLHKTGGESPPASGLPISSPSGKDGDRSSLNEKLFGSTDAAARSGGSESTAGEPVLQGILDFGGTRMAIIDGKVIRAGEKLSSGWVESIQPRKVLWRAGNEIRQLHFSDAVLSRAAGKDNSRNSEPPEPK